MVLEAAGQGEHRAIVAVAVRADHRTQSPGCRVADPPVLVTQEGDETWNGRLRPSPVQPARPQRIRGPGGWDR